MICSALATDPDILRAKIEALEAAVQRSGSEVWREKLAALSDPSAAKVLTLSLDRVGRLGRVAELPQPQRDRLLSHSFMPIINMRREDWEKACH